MMEPMRRYVLTRVDASERMECRAYMKRTYLRYVFYVAVYCIAMIVIGLVSEWDMYELCTDLALVSFCLFATLWCQWVLWAPPTADEMAEIGDEIQ